MTKKFQALVAMLLAFSMIAAACGSDDEGSAPAEAVEVVEEAPAEVVEEAPAEVVEEAPAEEVAEEAPAEEVAEETTVGLVYDLAGRGDQSFNDSAAAGLDASGAVGSESTPNEDGSNRGELLQLSAENNDIVFGIGFAFADDMAAVAAANPDTNFAIVDGVVEADNVASLLFTEEQGSYLVGAAAAMKSETGHIGFIGGVSIDLILKFEAGYTAGAKSVNPDIIVDVKYISDPPDFSGFGDPGSAKEIANSMYAGGADVVYHAAGGSGGGLFEAAKETSEAGTHVWAIGVDSDQYLTADASVQPYILTSMLKRVDVAVENTINAQAAGTFVGGFTIFDLSVDGVGYATSGGFVDDIAADLDAIKASIIAGDIVVPTAP